MPLFEAWCVLVFLTVKVGAYSRLVANLNKYGIWVRVKRIERIKTVSKSFFQTPKLESAKITFLHVLPGMLSRFTFQVQKTCAISPMSFGVSCNTFAVDDSLDKLI